VYVLLLYVYVISDGEFHALVELRDLTLTLLAMKLLREMRLLSEDSR